MEEKDFSEGIISDGTPFMPLLIRNPKNGKSTIIELLIDSGAQHTLISKKILKDKLDLKAHDIIREISIQGIIPKEECIAYCPEFLIDIFINRQWLKQIRVVEFDFTSDHGILGRNILQFFNFELNFLKKTVKFI
jgi:predicted aspartyl protease